MTDSEVLVRYPLDEIMGYKALNNVLPENLEAYCLTNNNSMIEIRGDFESDMNNIITSAFHGVDPNDIVLKNSIREILNRISGTTFDKSLEELRVLKYSCKNHFTILANELLDRSMNDPVVSKGFHPSDSDMYISNLNAAIAQEFNNLCIDVDGEEKPVRFKNVLTTLCHVQFTDFMNTKKKLDSKNRHRIDNFKGFMNFLGLLHNKNILGKKIIFVCLYNIKELIYRSKWDQAECANLFAGYERLMNQILFGLNSQDVHKRNLEFISNLLTVTNDIEEENKKNEKLKRIYMLTHSNLMKKLKTLYEETLSEQKASATDDVAVEDN